jgi:hypothetical protein
MSYPWIQHRIDDFGVMKLRLSNAARLIAAAMIPDDLWPDDWCGNWDDPLIDCM